jgi:surfeit locus 1 family protein
MAAPGFRKPALWPTAAAIAGIVLTLALGNWQIGRGHEKAALAERIRTVEREPPIALSAAEIRPEDVLWHRVEATGRFEPKYTVLIDNRILRGVAGYHVVTPLRLAESERYVLVERGWIAGTSAREKLPEFPTPSGTVRVIGLAVVPPVRYLELSSRVTEGRVWQNLTLDRFRAAYPLTLQPVIVRQENDAGDGLTRIWGAPYLGIEKHYGYAFQWFALAALIVVLFLVFHVRKRS